MKTPKQDKLVRSTSRVRKSHGIRAPQIILKDFWCTSCNKKAYQTRGRAIKVALRTSVKYGKGIRYYWCREAEGYHTTSKRRA